MEDIFVREVDQDFFLDHAFELYENTVVETEKEFEETVREYKKMIKGNEELTKDVFFLTNPNGNKCLFIKREPIEIKEPSWKNLNEVIKEYQIKWDEEVRKKRTGWIYHFDQKFLKILTNLSITDVRKDEYDNTYSIGLKDAESEDIDFGIVSNGNSYSFCTGTRLLVYGYIDEVYNRNHDLSSLNFEQQKLMDEFMKVVHKLPQEMYKKLVQI